MSAAHKVLYCQELFLFVCLGSTVSTLSALHRTSKCFRDVVQQAVGIMLRRALSPYLNDFRDFQHLLESTSSLIQGDVAWSMATMNMDVVQPDFISLDIAVSEAKAKLVRAWFIARGYRRKRCFPLNDDFTSPCKPESSDKLTRDRLDVPIGASSCTDLVGLDGGRRRHVRVIVCHVQPTDAVRQSLHTAHCNIISSTKLCVVYPNLTNDRQYMFTRRWKVKGLVTPLKKRRFYKTEGHPEQDGRRVFDNLCMVLDWNRGDSVKSQIDWMAEGVFSI